MAPILTHFLAASATQSAITLKQRPDEGDTKSTPAECKQCRTPHFLTRQDSALQEPHRITLENHRERDIVTLPHVPRVPHLGTRCTTERMKLHKATCCTELKEGSPHRYTLHSSRSQPISVSSWLLSTGTWAARKLRPSTLHRTFPCLPSTRETKHKDCRQIVCGIPPT